MNLERLREATAEDHERTEAAVPLMADTLTLDGYTAVLRRMYGFVRSWEQWAGEHAPEDLQSMVQARRRSGLLEKDLRFFGYAAEDAPSAPAPVEGAASRAAFLGRMYVMEGSTLGGQYLAAEMEKRFGLRRGEGNAYFVGYGTQTGSMWKEFRERVLELADKDEDEVIEAAKQMFSAFRRWLAPSGGDGEPRKDNGTEQNA